MVDVLKDKVAIVTGSGRGIGRGVIKLMAAEGAKVVVVDPGVNVDGTGTDNGAADQVVAEIKEAGGTAVASYESVATMQGGERIVQTTIDSFGRAGHRGHPRGNTAGPHGLQHDGGGVG